MTNHDDNGAEVHVSLPRTRTNPQGIGNLYEATATNVLRHCSVGKAPSGFMRLHAEVEPGIIGRFVGYDPRSLAIRSKNTPANVPPEVIQLQRNVQRSIDPARVASMVNYLRNARTGGFADWGPIHMVTEEEPDLALYPNASSVILSLNSPYFITDGQHRYCAILDFCRESSDNCKGWTQGITISFLPPEKMLQWAGQAFHDMNRLAKPVNATLALRADTRDIYNQLARAVGQHKVIQKAGGLDMGHGTAPPTSPYFTTLALMHKVVRGFHLGRKGLDTGPMPEPDTEEFFSIEARLREYFDALGEMFPSWGQSEGREEYLSRSSAALQALAVFGHDLYAKVPEVGVRAKMMALVSEHRMDWRKSNIELDGILGTVRDKKDGTGKEIQPASARQYIDATISYLRGRSGMLQYVPELRQEAEPE